VTENITVIDLIAYYILFLFKIIILLQLNVLKICLLFKNEEHELLYHRNNTIVCLYKF